MRPSQGQLSAFLATSLSSIGLLLSQQAHACSFRLEAFRDVSPEEFVFYGEVIGYSSAPVAGCTADASINCPESWGLRVKVLVPLQVPPSAPRVVDLFAYGLESDCSALPISEEQVRRVAVGSKLEVAAKPFAPPPDDPSRAMLDASDHAGAIVVPLPSTANVQALASSNFNYIWAWSQANPSEYFELRKDLLRLKSTRSESEAAAILFRLAGSDLRGTSVMSSLPAGLFEHLFETYLRDSKWKDAVIRRREANRTLAEDRPDAAGYVLFALEGTPYFQVIRGLFLAGDHFDLESLDWFERAAEANYLPGYLHTARAALAVAASLEAVDPAAAARYRRKSNKAFETAREAAQRGAAAGDAMSMLVLASLYRAGEAGLPEDEEQAVRWECRGMVKPPNERIPGLGHHETLGEYARCDRLMAERGH